MTTMSITITSATSAGFTADVLKYPNTGLNRAALRRLIIDLAAAELGTDYKGMRDLGYDVATCEDGWTGEPQPVPGGRRLIRFTVRPLTARERGAILRERGGFVDNGDGSMGFIMPRPRPAATPVKVRQRGAAVKPKRAKGLTGDLMDQSRLK